MWNAGNVRWGKATNSPSPRREEKKLLGTKFDKNLSDDDFANSYTFVFLSNEKEQN